MATTTINATLQGYVQNLVTSANPISWNSVRDDSVGQFANTYVSNTLLSSAITEQYTLNRGGYSCLIRRTFLFFDISNVEGTITSVDLKVLGYINGDADVIAVKSSSWGGDGSTSTLSTSDFSSLDFSTNFSSELTTWNTNSYNVFNLNSDAISNINSNRYLNVALIGHDYDYKKVQPSLYTTLYSGIEFLDSTDPIKIDVTYIPPVSGIYPFSKVNGVESSNISKVNGI